MAGRDWARETEEACARPLVYTGYIYPNNVDNEERKAKGEKIEKASENRYW